MSIVHPVFPLTVDIAGAVLDGEAKSEGGLNHAELRTCRGFLRGGADRSPGIDADTLPLCDQFTL